MSNMSHPISSAAPDELHETEFVDPARQAIEPKGADKKKLIIAGLAAFLLVMLLVFVVANFTKSKLNAWNEGRKADQAEKIAKTAESPSTRKAISFANGLSQPTAGVTTPANKPSTPGQTEQSTGDAIPLKNGQSTGQTNIPSTQNMAQQSPPSMMLGSSSGGGNGNGNGSGNSPGYSPNQNSNSSGANKSNDPARISTEELLGMISKANGTAQPVAQPQQNANTGPPPKTIQEVAALTKDKGLTKTKQVSAANLGNRNFVITRGHHMPCVLETQIMSNLPGTTACILTENIYSTNGKVMLLEKGTRAVGEYQNGLRSGDTRLAILWHRVETPTGVVIDIDSPSADMVGASGVNGYVDNRWIERIGAAFLLSFIQDAIAYKTAQASSGSNNTNSPTYGATTGTSNKMAEKILENTINIAPTLVKNRGDLITIEVKHDLWFQDVYSVN